MISAVPLRSLLTSRRPILTRVSTGCPGCTHYYSWALTGSVGIPADCYYLPPVKGYSEVPYCPEAPRRTVAFHCTARTPAATETLWNRSCHAERERRCDERLVRPESITATMFHPQPPASHMALEQGSFLPSWHECSFASVSVE